MCLMNSFHGLREQIDVLLMGGENHNNKFAPDHIVVVICSSSNLFRSKNEMHIEKKIKKSVKKDK